ATGAGKTTTIKLLNRFYDIQKGSIKVSGVDVREWDLRALRRHIGVVLQDVFLFSGDVRANLALGDPSIPLERIERSVDGREWDLRALRRHIGVVLQDVFLFSGDVRANLALGDPSIPLERIERS